MRMLHTTFLYTGSAQVEVLACSASVAIARLDRCLASIARGSKGRCLWVVQVVEHHHAAMLCAANGVKLVVVALTERQKVLQATHALVQAMIQITSTVLKAAPIPSVALVPPVLQASAI